MGPGRAGAYTYDWIENLAGLDMHSADELLPEFQDIEVGDGWQARREGTALRVAAAGAGVASLVLALRRRQLGVGLRRSSPTGGHPAAQPQPDPPARASAITRALTTYLMEPGSLVMERKMLLGIKQRAGALQPAGPSPARIRSLRPRATRPRPSSGAIAASS